MNFTNQLLFVKSYPWNINKNIYENSIVYIWKDTMASPSRASVKTVGILKRYALQYDGTIYRIILNVKQKQLGL